ncbi:putative mitochondrial co-chaperone GrpE [Leptomonas pyrrhocoris]|uniref:GrpE protein homolog n=1 Tax=Leptomonas pyrrhocoris TaxID=157538 RepID=A0A0M9G682_LEPPY|nr:putative mitochondrial co-chaperone GrpE [Leptomonas pyrrhocoris]KPA83066.1 putative mitochondrial co-chaperone GrpE [Leptomonas pyrrhocoris]|eukprot:XP_015661505.1 putative mitochondrial co-chaperone GrpE [Leptomonas pyrrhocoris]
MRALSLRSGIFARGTAVILCSQRWCSTEAKTEKSAEEAEASINNTEEVVPLEALQKVEKQLEEAKSKVEQLKKDILYRAADAENARRIGREDVEKAKLYGITSFGKDMLEVADTLEKAIEAFATFTEEELKGNKMLSSIHTGVKLSSKVLLKHMSKHGIEKMGVTVGTKFDPNLHDALVSTPPTDQAPSDHVSNVLKDGYMLKSRVLRAAQVGVSHSG